MKSVLVKIQAFIMSGGDGIFARAYFYLHGVVVYF